MGEGKTDVGDGARREGGEVKDGLHSGDRPSSLHECGRPGPPL